MQTRLEKVLSRLLIEADTKNDIKNFLKQFEIFKNYLAAPDNSLKTMTSNFNVGMGTYEENGVKVKHRQDWEDNVLETIHNNKIKISFSNADYNEYVQEYQDFKSEKEKNGDDEYIESSDALTAMRELKEQ